ncbi:hypothetical protein C6502_15715 [Candidatus Poribacteria bacterium]|nr:MAG: hypothetical protein C6502_15715 [Candidatus Poribacteria bacterium]
MFKCHLVPYLIGICKYHHIAFISSLILIISSQKTHPQQQIAQDAYAIFEQSCLICHGPDGAYKETLLIEHNALITENGSVVPGNPETSRLYKRLLGEGGPLMPLGGPPLPDSQIETIKNWILAGAPDWAAPPTTDGQFIPPSEVLNTIETHLMSLSSFDRAFARYFTMTHLYNAGESAGILQEYRKALYKLVNSLSWGGTVINPEPIDQQETIFYIDLRHYEWDVNDAWGQIETAYPYHIGFEAPTQTSLRAQLGRLQTETKSSIPSVHVDWFVATAATPPLYHDILSLPLTDKELETRLGINVNRNLRDAPGVRVWRAGFNNSGVSNNNRMVERHAFRDGAYWKSYDFAGNVGTQNIFNHPLDFTHDGGEVIFNLPNGLQAYYLANAIGFRLDEAPINIVSNPAASDPTVRNGISCFGCHTEGMKTFDDQVRAVIESKTNPTYDKAQALRLYVEQSEMDTLLQGDMERYKEALEATGGMFDDIEPISRFHEAFHGPVDAAYAAAVVGLETEAFLATIRENVGLQNAGLLVLDSASGSMKRDAWTSNFRDIVFALNFPTAVVVPPIVTPPEQKPEAVVQIPDTNLRAAIAEALGKGPNTPITVEEMEGLGRLVARNRSIRDLTGIQFATNLRLLRFDDNEISDLSPLAGLINLRELRLDHNFQPSDLSPLAGLINLEVLDFTFNVSDLSPLAGLINLEYLHFTDTNVSDFSPLAGLINLESLGFNRTPGISDISPLAGLVNLKFIGSWGNAISDLSPLAGLTKLEMINFCGGNISDLTPLAGLTGLKELYLARQEISDISPLANLTGLTRLDLHNNDVSDISPLAKLTQLKWLELRATNISDISPLARLSQLEWLDLHQNNISSVSPLVNLTQLRWLNLAHNNIADLSPLDGLRENITLTFYDNPAFPKGGPKIEGPWLWVVLPDTTGENVNDTDWLSEASGGEVTEVEIATHGATEGNLVGDSVWTFHRLPPTGWNNIEDMLKQTIPNGTVYGTVSLHSPREQETTMYVGGDRGARVWLNGPLIYERLKRNRHDSEDYTDFFPVTLKQGRNVLLVAVHTRSNGFFGFEPDTEYTVANPSVGHVFSQTPIHTGDTFTFDIRAENVFDLAGWQFDIAFDPTVLEAIEVTEGDFLKIDSGNTFFRGGSIDNAAGKITGLSAIRLSTQGVTGTGTVLQVKFKAKSSGETELTLQNFEFASITGEHIPAVPQQIYITVEEQLATGDVNRDGRVSILDLVLIAQQFGQRVPADSPVDLNGDGIVSILDLVLAIREMGNTTALAPAAAEAAGLDPAMIEAWIAQARLEDDGSLVFKQGIEFLESLLASLIPKETALLRNYPNPFNPETWIPYQLAESANVTLMVYDMNGRLIRRLALGYQAAGMYQSRGRAAYWDGRNQLGESVASGLYFYTLTAGEFSATRRMLILK